VKVKTYLKAIGSTVNSSTAVAQWKNHFGWGDDHFSRQGGAQRRGDIYGGSAAFWITASCLQKVHAEKLKGAL
jgi:hypothetical protein